MQKRQKEFSFQPFDLLGFNTFRSYVSNERAESYSEMRKLFRVVGLVKPGAVAKEVELTLVAPKATIIIISIN